MGPGILPETTVGKHNLPCHLKMPTKALSCKKEEAPSCPVGQGSFKMDCFKVEKCSMVRRVQILHSSWKSLKLQKLITSIPRRLQTVLKRRGDATPGVLNRRPVGRIRPVCINFVARVMLKINVFLLQFALKILGFFF